MILLDIFETSLPLTDPVMKFLLILLIILFAPIALQKISIPPLLGLIIAGAIIGPNGLNLMERDSGIILSGTAGLLYIMFLAGLDIDLGEFKKNRKKSIVFGMYTFLIPMLFGFLAGIYILNYSIYTSILLASMFASHTLIAYPLISKLGAAKNTAVNITIGGTMITDTLALLVLAIIVKMTTGTVDSVFWIRLVVSLLIFVAIISFAFPAISRWFFKKYDDNASQYIFVLVMVFLAAVLSELAGIEPIIGAFFAGLALNRLIPKTSPLMNRIDFVGNAIFIPFFLIGVGMLIDYKVFYKDLETIKVATVMVIVATSTKFLAAWLTQKTYKLSADQRRLIFGLSNAQAAATLAAVLVGYNIVLGESLNGEPIRLLDDYILNGTIIMILVTCTIASFQAQKGAKNIALSEMDETDYNQNENEERILIPLSNIENIDELINLGIAIKSTENKSGLFALNIINNDSTENKDIKNAEKLLNKAAITASATDNYLKEIIRYDLNVVNGISSVVKEHKITNLILGLHIKKGISDTFIGHLTEGILMKCNTTTLIYKAFQPFGTLNRHIVIVPEHAELEVGFTNWTTKIWNLARNSGTILSFYAPSSTLTILKTINTKHPVECTFHELHNWEKIGEISKMLKQNDNVIFILSRQNYPSYQHGMSKIPNYLNNYFNTKSYILIYPMQENYLYNKSSDLINPSLMKPINKLDEVSKKFGRLFNKK